MTAQPIPYTVNTWDAFGAAQSSMFGNSAPAPSTNTNTQPVNQPTNIPQQPTWQSQASRQYVYPQNQQQQFCYPTYNSGYPGSYQGYSNGYSVPSRLWSGQPLSNYYNPGFRPNMSYASMNGGPNPFSQQTSSNNMTASTTPATSSRVLKSIVLNENSPWKFNTVKGTIEEHLQAHAIKWGKIHDQAKTSEMLNDKKLRYDANLTEKQIQSRKDYINHHLRIQNRALNEIIDIQECRHKLYNGNWQSQMSVKDVKDLYREHGRISTDNSDGKQTLSPWTVISQNIKKSNYSDDEILDFYEDSSVSNGNTTSDPTTTAGQNTTQSDAQTQEAFRSILYGWKSDYDNRSSNANSWSRPSSYYDSRSQWSGPSYQGPGSFAYNPGFGPAPMQYTRAY